MLVRDGGHVIRDSLDEATHPWQQHAVDATEGTRKMMRDMGLWFRSDDGVAKRATLPTMDSRKNANLVKRAQALRTASTVVQPTGFTFTVMDAVSPLPSSTSTSKLSLPL